LERWQYGVRPVHERDIKWQLGIKLFVRQISPMAVFELILALLLGGVGLVLISSKLGMPWPSLLALAGVALALIPGIPAVSLEPDLALALFVAPILLDSGYDASPRDLRDNWLPVGSLVLAAVGLTVTAVAFTAHWLEPAMPWAAAVALGAIVAPPDASAATAVLREVRLPHRMRVILEGESLLNDASALLIYRFAIGAVAGGVTVWTAPLLAMGAIGGIILGTVLARLYFVIIKHVDEGAPAVVLQFLSTFGVWLLADALGLSAVLTLVAYAIGLARRAPGISGARHRRASYAVWGVTVFVLNVLAFILIGLQLRGILARLDGAVGGSVLFAGAVLLVTILVRFIWVMTNNTVFRWKERHFIRKGARPLPLPNIQGGLVISWCGMRGIVTLAAALSLPEHFPQRDLIVFTAFCVVVGTLVVQGLTLRPLLSMLTLPTDNSVDAEIALARKRTAQAALAVLGVDRNTEAGHLLALQYEGRIAAAGQQSLDATGFGSLHRRTLAAERTCLAALRREGHIGDNAFHLIEEELDWAEAEVS
jgi:monovalent cation/hydrogen antiporter